MGLQRTNKINHKDTETAEVLLYGARCVFCVSSLNQKDYRTKIIKVHFFVNPTDSETCHLFWRLVLFISSYEPSLMNVYFFSIFFLFCFLSWGVAETDRRLTGQVSHSCTLMLHLILTVQTWQVMYFARRGADDGAEAGLGLALQTPTPFASRVKY